MTSKGDGLLRSNLPLGDTILRGGSYFVTGLILVQAVTHLLCTPPKLKGHIFAVNRLHSLVVARHSQAVELCMHACNS